MKREDNTPEPVAVIAAGPEFREAAERLAGELGLPLVESLAGVAEPSALTFAKGRADSLAGLLGGDIAEPGAVTFTKPSALTFAKGRADSLAGLPGGDMVETFVQDVAEPGIARVAEALGGTPLLLELGAAGLCLRGAGNSSRGSSHRSSHGFSHDSSHDMGSGKGSGKGPGPGPLRVDFGGGRMRRRRQTGQGELLGRAVRAGRPGSLSVIDATAGLGRDSFVLADLGCDVTMLERSPVIFALLRDGLARGLDSGDPWLEAVCGRLSLRRADALEWLPEHPDCADVVCLDPMYLERNSALAKKDTRWLQRVVGDDSDQGELLAAALVAARKRVVVKRHARAPSLPGREAHHGIAGKTVRLDVYNSP